MKFCIELGFERVNFESDAQVLINAIKGEEVCWAWYGNLIEDVRQILKNISLWSIDFVHREGNQVAHLLAKNSLLLFSESIWIEETLSVVHRVVLDELVY